MKKILEGNTAELDEAIRSKVKNCEAEVIKYLFSGPRINSTNF